MNITQKLKTIALRIPGGILFAIVAVTGMAITDKYIEPMLWNLWEYLS